MRAPALDPLQELVRTVHRRYHRRLLAQAGLDWSRRSAAGYLITAVAGSVVAELVRPGAAFRGYFLNGPAGRLAGAFWGVLFAVAALSRFSRERRSPEAIVSWIDATEGWSDLGVTAWEVLRGRLRSPFGPALARRAGAAAAGATPRVMSRLTPLSGVRRSALVLGAALLLMLPAGRSALERAAQQFGQVAMQWRAAPGLLDGASLSPAQVQAVQEMAQVVQEQATLLQDSGLARAAGELSSLIDPGGSPSSAWGEPGAAGDSGPGLPGSGTLPGLERLDSQRRAGPGGGSSWVRERLMLLSRLAELGLVSPETADRTAEILAMLEAGSGPLGDGPTPGGSPAGENRRAPGDESQVGGAGGSPAAEGAGGAEGDPGSPAERGMRERDSAASRPHDGDPPDDGRPEGGAAQDEGELLLSRRLGAQSGRRPGGQDAGQDGARPLPDTLTPQAGGAPGTTTGQLYADPGFSTPPAPAERIGLFAEGRLNPGAASEVAGPRGPSPASPASSMGDGPPGASPPDLAAEPAAPAVDLERVPLEYRDAVQRYFDSMAREGG